MTPLQILQIYYIVKIFYAEMKWNEKSPASIFHFMHTLYSCESLGK